MKLTFEMREKRVVDLDKQLWGHAFSAIRNICARFGIVQVVPTLARSRTGMSPAMLYLASRPEPRR